MRKKVIAGNWKMYKTSAEARQLVTALIQGITAIGKTRMIVCPPATALVEVASLLKGTSIALGAQNIHWEKEGAFTGEISAGMIKSVGALFVILGHSERRQYFGETDGNVNRKIMAALGQGLIPIVCVGETLDQREKGITKEIVAQQLDRGLTGLKAEQITRLIFAYEPVWAIGTGKNATPEQAQEVHQFIRNRLTALYNDETAQAVTLLYGGSVKPNNALDLLKQADIDGALVGGACLQADSFLEIIKAAESTMT
jgi:triosephosphate isomerase